MAFEEEIHQQKDEEVTQLQKQKENAQFQRELDEIIARLENEQFQKELDEIIERLEHESQEHEEDLSSHESESKEEQEQQDTLEKLLIQSSKVRDISYEEENFKEENQDQKEADFSIQFENQDPIRTQDLDRIRHQSGEESSKLLQEDLIIEHLDHTPQHSSSKEEELSSHDSIMDKEPKSFEQLTQSTDAQIPFNKEKNAEEEGTQNQDYKNIEKLTHKNQENTSHQFSISELNLKSVPQETTREQKEESLNRSFIQVRQDLKKKEEGIESEKKTIPHSTLESLEKRIIEQGKKIRLNSGNEEINAYTDLWNEYIKKGGKIAQPLKVNFDLVAVNTNQDRIARVKLFNHREWMLRSCRGIESAREDINKWIPNCFLQEKGETKVTKCRTGTILEWLKSRDRISINDKSVGEGPHKIYQKKSFYEIELLSDKGQSKTLFISNKKTNWNPNGFQSNNYSPSRKRKSQGAIANELLEPISYHSLVTDEKRHVFRKMQKIFPKLKKPAQIPSRYIIYKPQKDLELDLFDDILVTEFYKLYNSRGSVLYQRASDYTQELIEKQLKPVIKYITTSPFGTSKENYFKRTVSNAEITITTKLKNHPFDSLRTLKGKKPQIKWIIKKEKSINNRIYQDKKTAKNKKHELIILGESISSNSDPSLIDSYKKAWNNHVTRGGIVVTELKKNYDTILSKIGKDKLVRVKFRDVDGWLLKDGYDVKIAKKYVNKWIPNAFPKEETVSDCNRARVNAILEWLKCRDKIKILSEYIGKGSYKIHQKKSFFEVKVQGGGQPEIFFIPNKATTWNPDGFKSYYFSPRNYGKSQSTIVHDLLDPEFFYALTPNERRQIFLALKQKFPQLKQTTQIGSKYTIYELQRNLDLDLFDDLLVTKFYNLYAVKSPSEIKNVGYNHIHELISKQPRDLIKYITNQSFSSSEGNFFKVVIVDRVKAFNLFKERLKHKVKVSSIFKQNQEFQKKVRELGLRRISMIYEKARLEAAKNVPSFHFTIENALEEGFRITNDYTNFWNEDHIDSFTGVAAGMMQSKNFRIKVLSEFKHLRFDNERETKITSDITGKNIVPGGSISPDISVKWDGEVVEEVEVKQLHPISRSIKDSTNPTMYWFDFFKTLEIKSDPIKHFSLHFINKKDDVESMGWDCAKSGIGGVIVEAGEFKGLPRRLNEIITAFSYERWPSAHRIEKTPKIKNNDLIMGIMERLEASAERKNQLREVITEEEVEDFVKDVHVFPKDYKQHRGYVEILVYVLRKISE